MQLDVRGLTNSPKTASTLCRFPVSSARDVRIVRIRCRSFPPKGPLGCSTKRTDISEWTERSLNRSLEDDWMAHLEARSVKGTEAAPAKQASPAPASMSFLLRSANLNKPNLPNPLPAAVVQETNHGAAQAERVISVPAVIEGTIEHPGDVDSFKLKVEPGQKLAFEIETLDAKPPYFNPRIGIADSQDHELFSNVERRLSMFNNNADPQVYLKNVQPKAFYSFERGGEYTLQVRDITSRYGNSSYQYRILVRPRFLMWVRFR